MIQRPDDLLAHDRPGHHLDLVGVKVEFIAQVGDGDLVDEVPFEDGDLVVVGEVAALLVHGETSVQGMLTQAERFSRFD
jgi:hypothetical protein